MAWSGVGLWKREGMLRVKTQDPPCGGDGGMHWMEWGSRPVLSMQRHVHTLACSVQFVMADGRLWLHLCSSPSMIME